MNRRWIAIALTTMALIGTTLACRLPGVPLPTYVTPTPDIAPTGTPVPSRVPPATGEAANALEAQVVAVYDLAGPAVVNITNVSYAYDFFLRPVPQEGTGSGFVSDAKGHIVTNYHVVENAEELSVVLAERPQ